mmetsp:Transcript_67052/g.175820  ORF Transcript_67052/g.175820 Transcript_67052/m.175820 type:complete len:990 (-) Transcript_67052:224-3193(-)
MASLAGGAFLALLFASFCSALGWSSQGVHARGFAPAEEVAAFQSRKQFPAEYAFAQADKAHGQQRPLNSVDKALSESNQTLKRATAQAEAATKASDAADAFIDEQRAEEATAAAAAAAAPSPTTSPDVETPAPTTTNGGDGAADRLVDDLTHIVEEEAGLREVSEEEARKNMKQQLKDFLEASGLKENKAGDVWRLFTTMRASCVLITVCFTAFSFLRRQFPQVYANNCLSQEEGGYESAPFTPSDGVLGWLPAALTTDYNACEQTSGTDAALCLVFINFVIRVMALVGLPLICVLCPLHFHFGTVRARYVAGHDPDTLGWTSSFSLNNIEPGHWLVWVHAAAVWYVVLMVEMQVFRAMRAFMPVRFRWLKDLRPPRSTTLLVENIPEEFCNDDALKAFFTGLFPDEKREVVEMAYVVKKIPKLELLVQTYMHDEIALQMVRHDLEICDGDEARQALKDKEAKHLASLDVTALAVETEQERVLQVANLPMVEAKDMLHGHHVMRLAKEAKEVTACNGFVAFTCERLALMVLNMRCYADADNFVMSIPPPASDIIYEDLKTDTQHQRILDIAGYFVISLVFYAFIPSLIFFAKVIDRVSQFFPFLEEAGLEGVLATLPLQIYLSMLPTVLFMIFQSFFSLKAVAWGQKFLQNVFFVFNVIFTLLITAVIGSLSNYPGGQDECIMAIIRDPEQIPGMLADSLPGFTHYYMEFMCVRWTTHCLELTRYVVLLKFILFRHLYGEEMALDLAEPEDQDFYGIGARSTRFALDFMVGLVFCTLSPLITGIVMVNAALSRTCFGYLLIFAETRKHDLGGAFFVTMMHQVQFGLLLYILFSMGIMARWSGDQGHTPHLIAGGTLIFLACAYSRFCKKFQWETLPFDEVCKTEALEQANEEYAEYLADGEHDQQSYRQWQLFEKLVGRHHQHHTHSLSRTHTHIIEGPARAPSSASLQKSSPRRQRANQPRPRKSSDQLTPRTSASIFRSETPRQGVP